MHTFDLGSWLPLIGVVIGSLVTFAVSAMSARSARLLAREADARRFERDDRMDARKRREELLRERLGRQMEVFDAYAALATRYFQVSRSMLVSDRSLDNEAHAEASGLYLKLFIAFGDENFANQAVRSLEAVPAVRGRGDAILEVETERVCGHFLGQMLLCVKHTIEELGVSKHGTAPLPIASEEEFSEVMKRARVVDFLDRHNLTKAQRDEALKRFEDALTESRKADRGGA